jgi:two-component system C4-dicarboxylate transport sensor histidine kinase DctB
LAPRAALTDPRPHWPRLVILSLLFAALISLPLIWRVSFDSAQNALSRDLQSTARLQVAVLQSELDKQRSAPMILAEDSDVIADLTHPTEAGNVRISKKLSRLQAETKSAVIYIVNADGLTLSASNWALPISFVGSNYSFRAYFRDALRYGQAEQFALGTVSRRPGLYLAHRVTKDARAVGVVVVKVEFDAIEQAWARAGSSTFVTDAANHVLLTSDPVLRFQPGPKPGRDQIAVSLKAPAPGWRLQVMASKQGVTRAAVGAVVTASLAELLIIGLVAWVWRRQAFIRERAAAVSRYRERLEHDVAARTEALSAANVRLSQEIRERRQAERRLNALQADLVQANKLASLGQITAGVAHEINQPLSTIRMLAENALGVLNAKAKRDALVTDNLGRIVSMSDRIGHITGELRAFSRKATGEVEPVSLKATVESSILLNQSRLRDHRVRLEVAPIDPDLRVQGGRIRLEQVLVNLLQNACEALEDRPDPEVRLSHYRDGDCVVLELADNGLGLKPEVLDKLFTPFVTSKPNGLGLGLVIAHDIVRDFGGELSARNTDRGALFIVKLKAAAT